MCDSHDDGTDGHELVHRHEVFEVGVDVGIGIASWHAGDPEHVHGEEGAIEADEGEEEVNLAESFVHHPSEHLGEPERYGSEDAEKCGSKEHVVKVGDDEVGVVDVDVDGDGGHEDATESTDDELRDECDAVECDGVEADLAAPDGANPVEGLDSRRECDHDGGGHEGHAECGVHAAGEHVVSPDDETQPGNGGHRVGHGLVAEDRFSAHGGEHVRDHAHGWQQHDVDGRV